MNDQWIILFVEKEQNIQKKMNHMFNGENKSDTEIRYEKKII